MANGAPCVCGGGRSEVPGPGVIWLNGRYMEERGKKEKKALEIDREADYKDGMTGSPPSLRSSFPSILICQPIVRSVLVLVPSLS